MLGLSILHAIPAIMKMQMKTMESHNQPFYYGKLGKHDKEHIRNLKFIRCQGFIYGTGNLNANSFN